MVIEPKSGIMGYKSYYTDLILFIEVECLNEDSHIGEILILLWTIWLISAASIGRSTTKHFNWQMTSNLLVVN